MSHRRWEPSLGRSNQPPVASLGDLGATPRIMCRQARQRAESREAEGIEPRNVGKREGRRFSYGGRQHPRGRYGEAAWTLPGVGDLGTLHIAGTWQLGRPQPLSEKEYGRQAIQSEEAKRRLWESDRRVVPMTRGNARRGKAATHHRPWQGNIGYTQG